VLPPPSTTKSYICTSIPLDARHPKCHALPMKRGVGGQITHTPAARPHCEIPADQETLGSLDQALGVVTRRLQSRTPIWVARKHIRVGHHPRTPVPVAWRMAARSAHVTGSSRTSASNAAVSSRSNVPTAWMSSPRDRPGRRLQLTVVRGHRPAPRGGASFHPRCLEPLSG
jgi:hypothetical protein